MAFDPSKDQLIWQSPEASQGGLFINIKKYGNYPAKVEFARVVTTNGQQQVKGGGRLDFNDLAFLLKYLPNIQQLMQQHGQPQAQQGQQQQQAPQFPQTPGGQSQY